MAEGESRRGGLGARLAGAVSGLARAAADTIVPPLCLSCRVPLGNHDAICASCWRDVRFIVPPVCDRLGIPMPYDTGGRMISAAAAASPPDWDRARAVAHFGPVIRDLIHGFKYNDRHDARRLFGRWLSGAGRELLSEADLVVPVPLHRWRLITRKFNQAQLLAAEVGRIAGVAVDPFVIERVKATTAQVGLSEAERRRNLSGAFKLGRGAAEKLEGARIVLIDDVITTGSTAAACARVLRRAGAHSVDVLALAMVTDESRIGA